MNKLRWTHLLALLLLTFSSIISAQDQTQIVVEPLHPDSGSELIRSIESGLWMATNGVVVRYGTNTVLVADRISLDETSGEIIAEGGVSVQNEGRLWRGDSVIYNLRTRQMKMDTFRVGLPPFYVLGQSLTADQTNGAYTATNALITTDDVAKPSYKIRVKSLKIIPGKSIEAEKATIYLGNVPVFALPSFSRSLERHPNNFVFTPGYRSLYGPFLLGSYNWHWSTNLSGALNLDYRQKRGVGLGPDLSYDLGRWGQGSGSFYYLHDEEPGLDPNERPVREDRHRLSFSHRANLLTNLTAKIAVREQSDAQIIRDFFESEHRSDPQPKSFLEVNQLWPNFSLNVLAQAQLNDFFQTVERLPDVKLSAIRQQLGISPFYYEGENSAGYFRFRPEEGSATNDYAALRADSLHQIVLPHTFFGWLNVTPRVGGRFTHYGETEGKGTSLGERNRGVFNTGAEVSFKASRVWGGARSKFWEVNELRHIIQPSINYVFVPSPSKAPRELPQFDTEIPSLRLLPIEFPDYNAIDAIDSQNVLRFTLHNKVQTKRKGEIDNVANWALYTDWRLDPRRGQGTFADLFSDLDLKPWSWLTLSSEVRYDIDNGRINYANHLATLQPNDVWSLSLGHLYFKENAAFGPDSGNNLFRSSIFYRFNENWGTRMTHHYEARDGVLEEQYYTLYRDLRNWTAALTLRFRDHRTRQDDVTVAVTFSLKAFPRYGVGKDRDKHWLLLGS
jgi:LPS-assembly protein